MVVLTALFACDAPTTEVEPLPPFAVGKTTLTRIDPRGRLSTIEVWYPAQPTDADPGPYLPSSLTFEAVDDAVPVDRSEPWPLVAFSHGHIATRFQSAFLTEHLAAQGFVVVAPDHEGDTLFGSAGELGQIMLDRPDDIRHAVDLTIEAAEGPGVLQGLVAEGPYAVMGHSFGALTALVVGGGTLDFAAALQVCEAGLGTRRVCQVISADLVARSSDYRTADDRVVATVAMSPFASFLFEDEGAGLAEVVQPLILGGGLDDLTPYDTEILPVYEHLSADGRMLVFPEAGHYSFSDICLLVPALFGECMPDGGYADLASVQAVTRDAVTQHLRDALDVEGPGARSLSQIVDAATGVEVQLLD